MLREPDIDAFISGMFPTPAGQEARDPSFIETFHRLFPRENIGEDLSAICHQLARFVDEELVGWWAIPAAKRISYDLRLASADPDAAPEPLRSWIKRLSHTI